MKKILLTILVCIPWLMAEAGGFQVVLQGVRQTSMGNAAVGQADNVSSIFFNPGAVAMLEKNEVAAGVSFIGSDVDYDGPFGSAATENPLSTPFYLFAAFGIGPKDEAGVNKMKLGLGVFTPFGSTTKWKDDWTGQAYLRSLSLKAIYVQPTFSYKINDKLGVGVGVDVMFGSVNLKRAIPISTLDGKYSSTLELDGKTKVGIGYNVGVFYKASDKFSVGLNYRSKVNGVVEGGDVNVINLPKSAANSKDPLGNTLFPTDAKFDATLPLPAVMTVGFAVKPIENLTLAADVRYNFWSVYEELKFNFDKPVGGKSESVSKRNYEDSFTFSLGAEYNVLEELGLRLGGYYDMSPIKEGYMTPETPDANTIGLTGGVGYTYAKKFSVDAGVLFVYKPSRSQIAAPDANTISGTFETSALIPSIGLSYKF